MTQEINRVTVRVTHNQHEETFSGSPEQVWLLLNKFFNQFIPSFELAQKLFLRTDLQELARGCESIIAIDDDGPHIMVPRNRLTDNETLALLLLAQHMSHDLGKTGNEGLTKEELQMKLGKDSKITGTRLGELVKSETITRAADEKYRITTFGLAQMQEEILPRIRAKTGL